MRKTQWEWQQQSGSRALGAGQQAPPLGARRTGGRGASWRGGLMGVCWVGVWCLLVANAPLARAADPPLTATLTMQQTSFLLGEPIPMQIVLRNPGPDDVVTRFGFLKQDFHRELRIVGPDGQLIRANFDGATEEPGPPRLVSGVGYAVGVEIVLVDHEELRVMDDARFYYSLTQPGHYTVQLAVPLETYSQTLIDPGTDTLVAPFNDPGRQEFDPFVSNIVGFDIVDPNPTPEAAVEVEVQQVQVGPGSTPGASALPLEGVPVHLYRESDIPVDLQPINFKVYELIADTVTPSRTAVTEATGIAKFAMVPQDAYLVLAEVAGATDFKKLGDTIADNDPGWSTGGPITSRMRLMIKADRKRVAGRTTRLTGSELLIIEPEFITWDDTQELYPFVFQSIGDWEVTAEVSPPEGFVTDQDSLSTVVVNDLKAVQFTITDVGSKWKETEVTLTATHKGKKTKLKHAIGLKLFPALAREKGLGLYGETPSPGPFKGNKKIPAPPGGRGPGS